MRKLLVILAFILSGAAASAQLRVDESLSFGYNRSYGMYTDDATMLDWRFRSGLDLRGGLRLHSEITGLELGARYYLTDNLGVEGFYIGQRSKEYGFREYNFGVLGVWNWRERVEVRAGSFIKRLTPFKGEGGVWEPLNGAYSVKVWALNPESRFNFAASLSNLDMFTAERFYCPMLTLRAQYYILDGYLLYLSFREHNSGIFDLTSVRYDRQFRIGTVITW